ncbi:MAG: hypothetical protein BGP02_08545 [Pandoraea sp. 64-18]|nr:MAG: hypothetical protein BGP02_08545 [Pandoraea sp. 64-18]
MFGVGGRIARGIEIRAVPWRDGLLVLLAAAVALLILGFALHYCRYGFDLTDESFYLTSIVAPDAYSLNIPVSLFGFVYRPLYSLVGGDIGALRQANVLITFGLASFLSISLVHRAAMDGAGVSKADWAMGLALAPMSLASFPGWLVTPSYNSLTFQSVMLALTGLLLMDDARIRVAVTGSVLVAVGGWLTFMGKPTTAALLGVIFTMYSAASGVKHLRRMVLAGGLSLLLLVLTAFLIDGSIAQFVARLRNSIEMLRVLGSGQEFDKIFRIDNANYADAEYQLAACVAITVTVVGLALTRSGRWGGMLGAIACAALAASTIWLIGSGRTPVALRGPVIFLVSAASLAGVVMTSGYTALARVPKRRWLLAALLLSLPHASAFGTNGNYWVQGASVALLWMLAVVFVAASVLPTHRRLVALVPFALVMQMATVTLISEGMASPYRQPPNLRQYTDAFDFPGGGKLVLAADYRAYLAEVVTIARANGLTPGASMIDLTGQSSGVLFALQTRSLGQPWMVGAYPGSDRLATGSLDTESCRDVGGAWLFYEPGGPRSLSAQAVVAHFGGDLEADYANVGTLTTPEGAGGYTRARTQYLLRPIRSRSAAEIACLTARKRNSTNHGEADK